jgi:cation diffusion facilitator family transporter
MVTSEKKLKQRAASLSVASNVSLLILKLLVGVFTRSLSVLAEAAHSANDLAAAVIAWTAVRQSVEPADESHPFGHGKFESVASFVEALLILVAAVSIIYAALGRITRGAPELGRPLLGASVMAASVLVNMIVSARLFRVAKKTASPALEADAWHLSSDVYSSLAVLIALAGVAVGQKWNLPWLRLLDPVGAVGVAAFLFLVSGSLLRGALRHLTDASLPQDEIAQIDRLLQQHYPQFLGYHRLRARHSGPEHHIDLHLVVPPNLSVQEAHALCDHLETDIRDLLPRAHLLIHVEPPTEATSAGPGAA